MIKNIIKNLYNRLNNNQGNKFFTSMPPVTPDNNQNNNIDYEFINVYYDFGISGFKETRPGFQKMMQDARDGKIDL